MYIKPLLKYYLNKENIAGAILLIAGTMLLSGVFIESTLINPDLQIEQYVYYNKYIFVFTTALLIAVLINKQSYSLKKLFYPAEMLIPVFALIMVVTYQWQLNPAPERLFFLLQICILWFLLRIANHLYPVLSESWLVLLMIFGGIQAFIGILQLYGLEYSNHSLFSMTGSFFNPGPYSGFLALTLPIAIYFIMHYRHHRRISIIYRSIYWCAWICVTLEFAALPATMGRTAWVASLLSSLWVIIIEKGHLLKRYRNKNQIKFRILSSIIAIGAIILLISSYHLKEASAKGRIFLWKTEMKTWVNNPIGVGIGGFPCAYGEAQANYFANENFTETDELIAGTPSYAFNEYLQLLIEHSFTGVIIILIIGCLTLYSGYQNKQTGWSGTFIALCIFSFASYPLQLPLFIVILIFASTGCICIVRKPNKSYHIKDYYPHNKLKINLFVLSLAIIECIIAYQQWNMEEPYYKWEKNQLFYHTKAYDKAVDSYEKLYPDLGHRPNFLFEYGLALAKINKIDTSNKIFQKGMSVSADPMFWNMMGKNFQTIKNYQKAEQCFLHSINILPGRLYPYYLLTKLYAESEFYQKDKMLKMGNLVLQKEPKVHSTAVKQMRNEIKRIIKDKAL